MTTPPFAPPTGADVALVSHQLGRPARNVVGIAARCTCGAPTVVATRPRLDDGTPFPTLYYLCHPAATAAISTLEATGVMPQLAALLVGDQRIPDPGEAGPTSAESTPGGSSAGLTYAQAYLAAHQSYLADRDGIEVVPELAGVSAGGMPTRVKCLHALAAHSLAAGPGVNPIGDLALEQADWSPEVCACIDYGIEVSRPDADAQVAHAQVADAQRGGLIPDSPGSAAQRGGLIPDSPGSARIGAA